MRRHPWRFFLPLLFVAVGAAAAGCSRSSDELPREAVSGTVTLDGQPLANGTISSHRMGVSFRSRRGRRQSGQGWEIRDRAGISVWSPATTESRSTPPAKEIRLNRIHAGQAGLGFSRN